jgi:hypothetical protein
MKDQPRSVKHQKTAISAKRAPPGLRVHGSRATEVRPLPKNAPAGRTAIRSMTMDTFIEQRGSGTLRKNRAIGMNVTSHALAERVAYEFGYGFEAMPERCVTWGEARSEPDCKPLTEAGWHIERYAAVCLFPGDEVEAKYLIVESDGERREGVGLIVRVTSAPFIPAGYTVFAIIAEFSVTRGRFLEAKNPC